MRRSSWLPPPQTEAQRRADKAAAGGAQLPHAELLQAGARSQFGQAADVTAVRVDALHLHFGDQVGRVGAVAE
jgi:hypothetical protein